MPEIAVVGRSNVGKSSLINSLLQRKALAKVSKQPGKTRALNVFAVATEDSALSRVLLVDFPGYGYARVSKSIRAQWAMIDSTWEDGTAAGRRIAGGKPVPAPQDQATIAWLVSSSPSVVVARKWTS